MTSVEEYDQQFDTQFNELEKLMDKIANAEGQ